MIEKGLPQRGRLWVGCALWMFLSVLVAAQE